MILTDAFHRVVSAARDMISEPGIQAAVAADVKALEDAAQQGTQAAETLVAGWLHSLYSRGGATPVLAPAESAGTPPADAGEQPEPGTQPESGEQQPGT